MKFTATFLILICSYFSVAQESPEPEFDNRPYLLMDGALTNFERLGIDIEISPAKKGYSANNYMAFTEKSPLRLLRTGNPRILIKIEKGKDPADRISLIKGTVKKKKRRFLTGGIPEEVSKGVMMITFKKIRDGFYEINLPALEPGEYAFITAFDAKISCFGVD